MRRRAILTAFAATFMVAGGATVISAAPAKTAPAAKDWTRVVVATAEGGYRVGNPDATVKLVEYGSLTCDHCANFAKEGVPQLLSKYVKGGRVSFEFRNFIRDPADLTAALLSRCADTGDFFALTDHYFATQEEWLARFQAMSEEQATSINALPMGEKLVRFAAVGGLDTMAAKAGVTPARAKQCLADEAAVERLVAMRGVAVDQHKLEGTPTFLINGKKAEGAHNWTALEPLLSSAGG